MLLSYWTSPSHRLLTDWYAWKISPCLSKRQLLAFWLLEASNIPNWTRKSFLSTSSHVGGSRSLTSEPRIHYHLLNIRFSFHLGVSLPFGCKLMGLSSCSSLDKGQWANLYSLEAPPWNLITEMGSYWSSFLPLGEGWLINPFPPQSCSYIHPHISMPSCQKNF